MAGKSLMIGLLVAIATGQVQAEETLPEPFARAWQACQDRMTSQPNDWIGWRRDFFNGYGDTFAYWSRETAVAGQPAVLRTETLIDGAHSVSTIYCFQADGRPALSRSVMASVNIADGPNTEAPLRREGWIFFKPDGALDRVIGRLVDDTGKSHRLDEAGWVPGRGCDQQKVALFERADDVTKAYVAEMGDIEGKRPAFKPEELNWCDKAQTP
ncbi:hypothetical protein [Labrys neptuniae]